MRDYDIAHSLHSFSGQILVLGAENDLVLDVDLSRELAKTLNAQNNHIQYVEFPKVGHTNLFKGAGFRETIRSFMGQFQVNLIRP